jgi:hypothetical protein
MVEINQTGRKAGHQRKLIIVTPLRGEIHEEAVLSASADCDSSDVRSPDVAAAGEAGRVVPFV